MKLRILLLFWVCFSVLPAYTWAESPPRTLPTQLAKLKVAKKIQKRTKKMRRVREDGLWKFLLSLAPVGFGFWLVVVAFSVKGWFWAFLLGLLGVGLIVLGAIIMAEAIDILRGK